MAEAEFILGPQDRNLVLNSVIDACTYRAWHLFCVHIRTNHVHAILQTDLPVDRVLAYLKARPARDLRKIPYQESFPDKLPCFSSSLDCSS